MKSLFAFRGTGRCEGTVAYVLGIDEQNARARLLRDDACKYFSIETAESFSIVMPGGEK